MNTTIQKKNLFDYAQIRSFLNKEFVVPGIQTFFH